MIRKSFREKLTIKIEDKCRCGSPIILMTKYMRDDIIVCVYKCKNCGKESYKHIHAKYI